MTMTTDEDLDADLTEADRAALQFAIDLTLADDPPDRGRVEQVLCFLNGVPDNPQLPARPWREVGEFCAYVQQMARLGLHTANSPPCWLDEASANAILEHGYIPACDGSGKDISNCSSAELLKQMLAAGVSKYHPIPFDALATARRDRRYKKK